MLINLNDTDNFIIFSSLTDKVNKLREWDLIGKRDYNKLISGKSTEIKPILYKGVFIQGETNCQVVGYTTRKLIMVYMKLLL
ncbi:hypothetical protein Clocel_0820 [Clostridium cellulovorans 743B]|uniref:Uncharacterized protein n=1 Tax=Clostridium cellulovorans (strain ATCC 35296 / DSM 3052 / OCM 3 / 743B) TaxID=573061 RepID=D9SSJ3_CLOC7|nr:hypothetical protein Clocel_0820 [Clostridium cellulovorans 743B]